MSLNTLFGSTFSPDSHNRKRCRTESNILTLIFYRHKLRIFSLALIVAGCFLFSAASMHAATYTVMAGGGGNYTTIQACATAMAAGDTCMVYAGTYNENVSLTAGTSGNVKTLTVNPGDMVYVYSFSISSYNTVNGFQIQNPSSPTSSPCVNIAANATEVHITKNTMYACNGFVNEAHNSNQNTTYVYIQGNTMSYACSTSSAPNVCGAGTLEGDHQLIEKNDMSHVSDGFYFSGQYIVDRNNVFHDTNSSDCGTNSSNCHIDFMQADATVPGNLPTHYMLFEGNTVHDMGGTNGHGIGLFQAESCSGNCSNAIVRFSILYNIANGGIIDDNSGSTSVVGWTFVKAYNNTWVNMNISDAATSGSGTNGYYNNSTNGSDINSIFYYPDASMPNFNPVGTDASSTPFNYGHDLAYCTGTCTLRSHVYGSGSWTDDPGNKEADPLFTNYAAHDFSLQAGSPALNAGTYETTVAATDAGSGTSLVVNDASYFQDGMGFTADGVAADCIAVTTTTNHVCVTAVNYSTNTLTLASSITRQPGDPVWLYSDSNGNQVLTGSAPDMGAYFAGSSQSGTTPPPPTGVISSVVTN